MEKPYACSFCGERTHSERKCPELVAPLKFGIVTEGVPRGGGGEEDAITRSIPLGQKDLNLGTHNRRNGHPVC
jgi:hypothetical protein